MNYDSMQNATLSMDKVTQELLKILMWLDQSGYTQAAIHVNQALEILHPDDPRIASLASHL